jgi:hypothetical protein
MVPGLFYRSLRAVMLKTRVARLPLYPPPVPVLSGLAARWRRIWDGTTVGFHTYFVIGALGRKAPPAPRDPGPGSG